MSALYVLNPDVIPGRADGQAWLVCNKYATLNLHSSRTTMADCKPPG